MGNMTGNHLLEWSFHASDCHWKDTTLQEHFSAAKSPLVAYRPVH